MKLSEIIEAIYSIVDSSAGLLPVKFPDETFNNQDLLPYAELFVSPVDTESFTTKTNVQKGFIHFNIYFPDNSGVLAHVKAGESFLAVFYDGLKFSGIRISQEGTVFGLSDNSGREGWKFAPVLIPYEAIQ